MISKHVLMPALLMTSIAFLSLPQSAESFAHSKLQEQLKALEKKTQVFNKHKKSLALLSGTVSTDEEVKIGKNVISGLLGAAPLVRSDGLQNYVNSVGFWIAQQSKRPNLPWSFGVINSPNINAFAAPGGYIVITLGLYQLLENESQLASILAHEISHIIEKHHLDAISKNSKGELLGALAVSATSKKHQQTMQKLVNSSVQIYANGLDKKFEFTADRRGLVLTARAGYDPYALLDVLTTLHSINSKDDSMAVFLNTHPPLSERIKALERLTDKYMTHLEIPNENQRLTTKNNKISHGQ